MLKIKICGQNFHFDNFLRCIIEGRHTHEKQVEYHPAAPYVTLLAIVASEHFGRHVVDGANLISHLDPIPKPCCFPEIDQFHTHHFALVFLNQNVFRFNVSVRDIVGVTVCNSLEELMNYEGHLNLIYFLRFDNDLKKLASLKPLFHYVNVDCVLVAIIYPHKVRVIQFF